MTKKVLCLVTGGIGDEILVLPAIRYLVAQLGSNAIDLRLGGWKLRKQLYRALLACDIPVRSLEALWRAAGPYSYRWVLDFDARDTTAGGPLPPSVVGFHEHFSIAAPEFRQAASPRWLSSFEMAAQAAAKILARPLHLGETTSAAERYRIVDAPAPSSLVRNYLSLLDDGPFRLAVSPGGRNPPHKRWPVSHFAESIVFAMERGANVLLLGSLEELAIQTEITRYLRNYPRPAGGRLFLLTGRVELSDLPSLLAGVDLHLTNDNGAAHIGGAINCAQIVLYRGPHSRHRTTGLRDTPLFSNDPMDMRGISTDSVKQLLDGIRSPRTAPNTPRKSTATANLSNRVDGGTCGSNRVTRFLPRPH